MVYINIVFVGVFVVLKSIKYGKWKGKIFVEEKSYDGLYCINVISNVKSVKKIIKGKLNVVVIKGIVLNINGIVLK